MNTIEKAVRYIKEPEALAKTMDFTLRTKDLEVPCEFVGAKTVRYQHIDFGDYDLGDFDRNNGYAAKDISLTWKEKTMTQDKGDSLKIDKMDDEEAMANGIVRITNRYIERVQTPAVDRYRLGVLSAAPRANVVNVTLTAENIIQSLLKGRTMIVNSHFSLANTVLYITATADGILEEAAFNKGYISMGNWNGNMDATVRMFKEAKKIVVPDDYFPNANVQAVLLNTDAVPAMKKYQESEYFDKIPGFGGRRAQADVGIYHECFAYDELNRAIVVFLKSTTTTNTVTYAGGAGATGTAPTQAATAPGAEFVLKANAFTLDGKTFVGWDDGSNLYKAGATYVMPNSAVTLTARWK